AQGIAAAPSGQGLPLQQSPAPAWPVMQIWATGKAGGVSRRLLAEAANFPLQLPETAVYACKKSGNYSVVPSAAVQNVSGYDYPLSLVLGNGNSWDGNPDNPADPNFAPV